MVNPVSGPFTRVWDSASFYDERKFWRQKPPYNLPLPGEHRQSICVLWSGLAPSTSYVIATGWINHAPPEWLQVKNRVVSKVLDSLQIADGAALGVTLVQYGQARQTIVQRTRQLLTFSRALKRLDFGAARRALSINADQFRNRLEGMPQTRSLQKRGWRGVAGEYGGAWLEWSWGIVPTVGDIVGASRVLTSDPPYSHDLGSLPKEAATKASTGYVRAYATSTPFTAVWNDVGKVHYQITGQVRCNNPNKALYDSLGLTDILGIAAEVTPWSFVLGWVSNLETYLQNWSPARDNWSLENGCETLGWAGVHTERWNGYPTWLRVNQYRRTLKVPISAIPTVEFRFKPLRFSPLRAANAVALLASFLKAQK